MRQNNTYCDLEMVIQKPRINFRDMQVLAGVGENKARKFINAIIDQMTKEGYNVEPTRKVVPTERALKYLGLNAGLIHREAKFIREMEGK